jgi:hypothetical protein
MQLVFDSMAAGTVPVMEPPPPPVGPQPVLPTFEEFLAQHSWTPVSTSPNYSTTTYRLFNTIIYALNISFQTFREPVDHPLVVVPMMASLPSHGARSLRSTEEVAVAVLTVAMPVAVTTWALAVLAVTNLAVVVDVLALKPLVVVVVMINLCALDDLWSFMLL